MQTDIQKQTVHLLNQLTEAQNILSCMEIAERMVPNAAMSQKTEECRMEVSRASGKILGLVLSLVGATKQDDLVVGMTVELLADNISTISGSVWGKAGERGVIVSSKKPTNDVYSGVTVLFPDGTEFMMYTDTPLRVVQK